MRIEIHYLPSIEYMALAYAASEVQFEVFENFPKQTCRNRTRILGANGVETLTIPVKHTSGMKQLTKDVQIDYGQDWMRRHKGAIQAAYGNAPFYEHFDPFIQQIFAKKSKYLVDLNIHYFNFLTRVLGKALPHSLTKVFEEHEVDSKWNHIQTKESWESRSYYKVNPYRQCFGESFEPNLSVLDLVMNHGNESYDILMQSLNK
jgi:hypothetical protein